MKNNYSGSCDIRHDGKTIVSIVNNGFSNAELLDSILSEMNRLEGELYDTEIRDFLNVFSLKMRDVLDKTLLEVVEKYR